MARGRYRRDRPAGLAPVNHPDSTGGEKVPWTRPKRHRRLLVEAEPNPGGEYPLVRNVYLQSALVPAGFMTERNTHNDLFGLSLPVRIAADLIKWAMTNDVPIVYAPPGNMAGHLNPRRRDDEQSLFDTN